MELGKMCHWLSWGYSNAGRRQAGRQMQAGVLGRMEQGMKSSSSLYAAREKDWIYLLFHFVLAESSCKNESISIWSSEFRIIDGYNPLTPFRLCWSVSFPIRVGLFQGLPKPALWLLGLLAPGAQLLLILKGETGLKGTLVKKKPVFASPPWTAIDDLDLVPPRSLF